MEVRDLVIFGKAPGESRGTGPADCLTVEHILRDHVSSAPELQYQSVAFQALIWLVGLGIIRVGLGLI